MINDLPILLLLPEFSTSKLFVVVAAAERTEENKNHIVESNAHSFLDTSLLIALMRR
jgi:hypothetical protein